MPGILNAGGPPPVPNPQPAQVSTSQGALSAPAAVPSAAPPPGIQQLRQPYFPGSPQPTFAAPPGGPTPGSMPMPPPTPSYAQTLAALRHFTAIRRALQRLMRDPDLGKTNVKPKIVDGVADLVADQILTAADAVEQLSNVPDRPFEQKMWVQQQLQTTDVAEETVIGHYQQGIAGMPPGSIDQTGNPDDHASDMSALMQQYGRGPRRA
ncbi:MAG: hypothetical protein C5B60_05860 [Chloroflexi bacterium]|nr:MAG: hypothetical protein C5B60_05860 [Chloroflexota bacterium]